ncbi:hypothetical protein I2I05_08275 [Hymenobacter sp. BT683]|uniref:Uncharacterized protein n=1 Tax=Hymenobacter jeongseonensis TaxID=2791027 RepID=A0ABS0IGA7_9BACT|nr:hypothetical protein [Hymenobacter jeongseonensis]MBF9237391.1 hypothetical protein [Hymenobacter jeongseonensis]
MKTAFAALTLALFAGAASAQQAPLASVVQPRDKTQSSPRLNPVEARADRLSSHMVRSLRLNGYQASKLRAINADKVAKMAAIERKNAGNQRLIDEQCNGVCKERDRELLAVLSNDQYSSYYGARSTYYKFDKDYASQSASILLADAVQNPAPARANDAVVGPAKTKPANQPSGNLGRNAR